MNIIRTSFVVAGPGVGHPDSGSPVTVGDATVAVTG
jgi:hypothetical protein